MIYQTIPIKSLEKTDARLVTYARDNDEAMDINKTRPAVVVCPGGGYHFCSEREAEPVALAFLRAGFQAFVLYYHVAPESVFPAAQRDLALAVDYVRTHAAQYHVDPQKVAVLGFSAGGHLAASLGVMWQEAALWQPVGLTPERVRPNALVLCYPVITAGEYAHRGSFNQLTGVTDTAAQAPYSLEHLVSDKTPPAFLWHTADDGAVPVQNSLLFATQLAAHHIPFEMHIYPHGVHGLSLADDETASADRPVLNNPYCTGWIDCAIKWLKATL